MAKIAGRVFSRRAIEAIELLGQLIRLNRIDRKMTSMDLAKRAGISRALLYRIEQGDPACSIGVVFETATIVGVPLFEPQNESGWAHKDSRAGQIIDTAHRLALLPKAVRTRSKAVKDDF